MANTIKDFTVGDKVRVVAPRLCQFLHWHITVEPDFVGSVVENLEDPCFVRVDWGGSWVVFMYPEDLVLVEHRETIDEVGSFLR